MPVVNLSPLFNDAQLDSAGNPLVGGLLFTYAAASTTKQTTYTSSAGTVAQANPIVLNARGEPANPIFLTDDQTYKFVLAPAGDTDPPSSPIRTIDGITGVNDIAAAANTEWVSAGLTPTFVSATSFTFAGDQTSEFHPGRRLRATVTAGTVYGTIAASAFTTLTTITLDPQSGALDSGLSAISRGIISAVNTSQPVNARSIVAPYGPLTAFENLFCSQQSASTATILADSVVVTNGGVKAVLGAVSLTVNMATSGANGLDTGSEAASTWYFLWVIWNGTTIAGLLSVSSTAPTMPSGYLWKGLVSCVRNDASSNFKDFRHIDNFYQYLDTAANELLTGGIATTMTTVSLASLVCPLSRRAYLRVHFSLTHSIAGTLFNAFMQPNGASGAGTEVIVFSTQVASVGVVINSFVQMVLDTTQRIQYRINAVPDSTGGVNVQVAGFFF